MGEAEKHSQTLESKQGAPVLNIGDTCFSNHLLGKYLAEKTGERLRKQNNQM